ncbi:MAG: hypothetical protein GX556_09855 [Fibrobacter sp.]|nr:hypothetical protein [Fibrobacter sp.]
MNQKITAYLPSEIVNSVKIEAATKGSMEYSELIQRKITHALKEFGEIKDYEQFTKYFQELTRSFSPSKRGRPWHKQSASSKKRLTLYLGSSIVKEISKVSVRFDISRSNVIELALKLSEKENANKSPLFIADPQLKFLENDYTLLKSLMKETGAEFVGEFLSACKYSWILKEIRKVIGENRALNEKD